MKKITVLFLSFIIVVSTVPGVSAGYGDTAEYLLKTVNNPVVSPVGGEWTVIALARSGIDIDSGYFEKYYANVISYVKSKEGVLHSRKHTEYSRVILALSAIGKDPENVGGYNLVAPILDYEKTVWQGINGPVWAIIALDCGNYGTAEARDKYIAYILDREKPGGGWSVSDTEEAPEPDITAMVLIALSKYRDRPEVEQAINRALSVLSAMQNEKAGFSAFNTEASESTAQVLVAISTLGIPFSDSRFVKNGMTLVDNINSFKRPDGSFSHTDETNLMATEQCLYALVAAERLSENKPQLFDMSDVERQAGLREGMPGKNPDVNVPDIKYGDKTFSDIEGHKNRTAVEELARRGIINGLDESTFSPDNTMTRAEFATITVRALGLPIKNESVFDDVKTSDWYSDYVNTAYHYGIVSGVSETEFNPSGTITTEQASAVLCRAAELCGMETGLGDVAIRNILAEFTDYMTVSEWAKQSVAFCYESGISDRSKIEIRPLDAVKRCEIADMLYNLLKGAMLI